MGIVAIIIGGIIGYLVAEKFTAKSWGMKLCYAVLCPIVFDVLVILIMGGITGSSYLAGAYATPFIIGSIAFLVLVLCMMKVVK